MELTWFVLIAILWTGYFVLEGFDFGVGMLLPVLGRDNDRRRLMLTTIGPHWDGNEVWLITAGGATFAAFPHWYATLFSGFYLPLLFILTALIVRGVGLEYRHKRHDARWERRWDLAIMAGSWVPAVLWGVAFTNIVSGVPIDARMEYTGSLLTLLNPLALLGGLTTALLFLTHGAIFLSLKTSGEVRRDARRLAPRLAVPTIAAAAIYLFLLLRADGPSWSWAARGAAAAALVAGLVTIQRGREGAAFAATSAATALVVSAMFLALFPDVMPSSIDPAWSLTYLNAASSTLTLQIMTGAAVVFTPVMLLYTGYTYWVFRRRIGVDQLAR